MNILIVTPFYKHDKNIASVRWTNIATRLAKKHNVIVVTQPHDDMDMSSEIFTDDDGVLVARVNQKTAYEKFAVKYFGGATGDDWQISSDGLGEATVAKEGFVRKLKNRLLFASMSSKSRSYAHYIAKNIVPKNTKIDVVISSACPFIEMLFGYELKKKLSCKWISDFRDLPFTDDKPHDAQLMKKIMKKQLASADAVVTIAYKGKDFLADGIVDNKDKIYVIRNGFSMKDARQTITQNDKILHIVHTGSLYGGTRKADMLFKAVKLAREENSEFKYILECAGGNNETLLATARKYNEETNVINHGFIPREEALDLQSGADILLALIQKRTGSFVAKLFEYMLNKKPVLAITCGAGDIGEETDYIRQSNLGIAVEDVTEETDIFFVRDYLLKQFELKNNGMPLEYNPVESMISEFDHDNIVKKIDELCLKV